MSAAVDMPRALLWLVDVLHRSERLKVDGKRRRLSLPIDDWLRKRLADANVDCHWHNRLANERRGSRLAGLIEVECGVEWHGVSTLFSPEAAALREYYGSAQDAYAGEYFIVSERWERGSRGDRGAIAPLRGWLTLFLLFLV